MVVGAGLAGLTCARQLLRKGKDVIVLEASDAPGGKLRTDEWHGFRLDRGFQVYFTAYPHANRELDLSALDLKEFEPGTLVKVGTRLEEVHREHLLSMALNPFLSISDKLATLKWNQALSALNEGAIWGMDDMSSEDHLRKSGFSDAFMDNFARPFFGGIFLDRSLTTSRRMFAFVWKMFLEGQTAVPSRGMQAIGDQLASMPVRTGAKVVEILHDKGSATGVRLAGGEVVEGSAVVLAVDAPAAEALTGRTFGLSYHASTCVYFQASEPPVDRPMLVVRGPGEKGLVNHVVPVSLVSPACAPEGEHLVSATVLGVPPGTDREVAMRVRAELVDWFPMSSVSRWRPLGVYRIPFAQYAQPVGFREARPDQLTHLDGLVLAGEYTEYSSIDGAMLSGRKAADLLA